VKIKGGLRLAFPAKVVLFGPMASTTELLSRSVAGLNALATVFLLIGYLRIKAGDKIGHGKAMGVAVLTSAIFLAVYLGSKVHLWVALGRTNITYAPDPSSAWAGLKSLYLLILIPHVILAIVVTPFIVRAVWLAKQGRFEEHKKLVRWVFPVWLYVSITGVIVWAFMEFSGSLALAAQQTTK
jgi:putative membrane protein